MENINNQPINFNEILETLVSRINALENNQNNQPSRNTREPKVPLPEKFGGERKKLRGFLNQLELVFMLNPTRYPNDATKIGVIGTLLTDKALAWFSPYLEHPENHKELLADYSQFKELLEKTFGAHDRALLAASKIKRLKQGAKSVSVFAAEFRLLASDLTWNDDALVSQFRQGLNQEVKDMLLHHDYPKDLESAISLAIRIDNRLLEHRQEMNSGFSSRPHVAHGPRPPPPPRNNGPAPMELGVSNRYTRLSEAEKQHRKDNNLCLYCGGADHRLARCPLAPRRKADLQASSSASIQGNGLSH